MSTVVFPTPDGNITCHVYKARNPDVDFAGTDGVQCILLQAVTKDDDGDTIRLYSVMVDDVYWGRKIAPSPPQQAPFDVTIVMGKHLNVRVMDDSVPVANENVSALVWYRDIHGNEWRGQWEPIRYTALPFGPGPTFTAALRTDVDGYVRVTNPGLAQTQLFVDKGGVSAYAGLEYWIRPTGHGNIYQKQDDKRDDNFDTSDIETWVDRIECWHDGHSIDVPDGDDVVLHDEGLYVTATGPPGTTTYTLWETSELFGPLSGTVTGVCIQPYSDIQWGYYRKWETLSDGDDYDFTWYAPDVQAYQTSSYYEIVFLVYDYDAVPLDGFTVYRVAEPTPGVFQRASMGVFDWGEYIQIPISPSGPPWGPGWLWVLIEKDGYCSQLFTMQWSVLHCNLRARFIAAPGVGLLGGIRQWHPRETHSDFAPFSYAYYATNAQGVIPGKFQFKWNDAKSCIKTDPLGAYYWSGSNGVQTLRWNIYRGNDVLVQGNQAFTQFATGWYDYPNAQAYSPGGLTIDDTYGGVIHGNIMKYTASSSPALIEQEEMWRTRVEERSEHDWHMGAKHYDGNVKAQSFSDLVCPYCGGPAWTDPNKTSPERRRGHCAECARAFGLGRATDCRTFFQTPTLPERAND